MNGRTHAVIGASLVPLSMDTTWMGALEATSMMAIAAGFALGPDIDHPKATISKALPKFIHETLHSLSEVAIRLVRTGSDRMHMVNASKKGIDVAHRSLTHTLVFSAAVGVLAYACAQSSLGVAIMVFISVISCKILLSKKGYRPLWVGIALVFSVIAFLAHAPASQVALMAWMGWISHVIADGCTRAGVPALWPLKIRGRRWWRLRILGSWLTSGDTKEWVAAVGVIVSMNAAQWVLVL